MDDKNRDKTLKSILIKSLVNGLEQESWTRNSTEAGPLWLQDAEKFVICESF